MDLRRILIIGALVVTGMFLLQKWNADYHQVVEKPTEKTLITDTGDLPSEQRATTQATDLPITDNQKPAAKQSVVNARLIEVKTDTLNLQIDSQGGNIVQLLLPKYPKYQNNPNIPFEMLQLDKNRTYIAQSGLVGPNGTNAKGKIPNFSTSQSNYRMKSGQNELVVDLKLNQNGVKIIKRYTFTRGSYAVKMQYFINNQSKQNWSASFYAQLKRDGSDDPSKLAGATNFNTFLGAAVRGKDKPYQKLKFSNFSSEPFSEKIKGGYAAILQHYFVSAWVPNQKTEHHYQTRAGANETYIVGFVNPLKTVAPGAQAQMSAILYSGPKIQSSLAQLADGLNLTVDYGWLWWLAQPMFKLLNFIHNMVGNWGWSIILLTVLVKIILYPLSATAYKSMANMRKVGPKIQALKEQFGDDRQKMGQAMMQLYKKEKINPMGGCLPIVIQMPVFLSLYWVLQESVELRQAPWMLWITDLSQKDPFFILPLIMGGTMFIQQFLNPTPPDPLQAKMMKMMPVVFTIFFLWFPAGLVLYWITNNSLSILQQWFITRQIEKKTPPKKQLT